MSLDENELILKLISVFKNANLLASNDDAAAFPVFDDKEDFDRSTNMCVTLNVDSMAEMTDFFVQGGMTWQDFGYKLVTISLSDIAAKGIKPSYFLSALSIPKNFTSKNFDELILGMRNACEEFNIGYLGGDLGTSKELVASGIALGIGEKGQLIRRDGAKIGDLVCTTGDYGWTGLAYKLAFQRGNNLSKINSIIREKAFNKINRPKPRIKEGVFLGLNKSHYKIHSSIDSSDGLFKSLKILSELSQVEIEMKIIPIAKDLTILGFTEEFIFDIVLNAAEEFEIIFLVDPEKINDLKKEFPSKIMVIGEVIGKGKGLKLGEGISDNRDRITKIKSWDSLKGNFQGD